MSVTWRKLAFNDELHAAVTIDGTSPLSLSGQAISLKNDAAAAITEVDTGTLADSDTKVPTSKAVKTVTDLKMLLTGSNLAIGSDADGDMYYRIAGVLTRLAKGTANYKLFMNAAGTAPEWASGFYGDILTYDLSTTGDASITSVPFKPNTLIIFGVGPDGSFGASLGFTVGSGSGVCFFSTAAGVWTYAAQPWHFNQAAGQAYCTYITMLSNGFTYTKEKYASPVGTGAVVWMALR